MADDIRLVIGVDSAPVRRAVQLLDNLESELRSVERAEEKGLITRERAAQETNRLSNEIARLRKVSKGSASDFRKFEKALVGSGKAARHKEIAIQQAGYQIQDFVVQIQGGINPLVAFSQQGSQLAGFFAGPWGAAIGLGIAVLGSLGMAIMSTRQEVKKFDDQLKETTSALDNYFDLMKSNSGVFSDVFEGKTAGLDLTSEAAKDLLAVAKIEAFKGIESLNASLTESVISARYLKSELEDTGAIINASFVEIISANMGGKAGKEVRGLYNSLVELRDAPTLDRQYEAALKAREIFKENVDVTGDLTERQTAFWGELSRTIQQMEFMGAAQESVAASWSDTTMAAEASVEAMRLFYEYSQRDVDAQQSRKDAVEAIKKAVDNELKSQQDKNALLQKEIDFTKESAEYKKLAADQARAQYMLLQQENNILGNNLTEVMATYDESVRLTDQVEASANRAKDLASALKEAASAMSSLLGFGAGIEKALAVSVAKVNALKNGADEAIAGKIASMRFDLKANKSRALAAKEADPIMVLANSAIASAEIDQIEASETERKRLQEANRASSGSGAGSSSKKSSAEEFKEYLDGLKQQAELEKQLVGLFGEKRAEEEAVIKARQKYGEEAVAKQEAELRGTLRQTAAQKELDRVVRESRQQQEGLADSIASSFGDAFTSVVDGTKSMKDAFRDMAKDIIKQLFEILVVKRLVGSAEQGKESGIAGFLVKGLGAMMGGGTGGSSLASAVPSAFEADGGAWQGGSKIKAYANGGVVGGPTYFPMAGGKTGLMGEAGPEAIMPLKRGANGKLGVQTDGGSQGNVVINQSFNFSANGDDSVKKLIAQAAPQIANMTKQSMMNERRRGGQMKATFG
jgi:hypothetical protein